MNCWNVCDDIGALYEGVCDTDMTQDQIANVLLGLRELYQLKFDTLFQTFEACIKDRMFD
jgi:hypothetical protein